MFEINSLHLGLLFFTGILGGIIGSISGGGGLIITPALLLTGLSPVQAIATQNLYAVPMLLSATGKFWKQGFIPIKKILFLIPILLVFSALGAKAVSVLPKDFLNIFVPGLLIALAIWVMFSPSLESCKTRWRLSLHQYGFFVVPFLAFYDGFFGTCSTTFYMISCIAFLGISTLETTAITKPISAISSLGALLFFAAGGNVMWAHGTALAIGGIIGAQIGATMAIKHGEKLIRLVLVITTTAVSLKLIWDKTGLMDLIP